MTEIARIILLLGALAAPGSDNGPAAFAVSAPSSVSAVETLRGDLQQIIRRGGLGSGAGLFVISLDHGDTLFTHNADTAFAPASNLKLFTSLAALHYLGPTFRYNTYLIATGPVVDGVLEGDVVLYGTGDPMLSDRYGARVLEAFADSLAAHGVREIRGDIVGDGSYFAGSGYGIGWRSGYSNALYAAPASALSYAENIATVEVRPSASVGGRPVVRILPGGTGMELVNRATTVASGRTRISVARAGYDGPVTVTGQISRRTNSVRYLVPVSDPPLFAAGAMRETIEGRGITVSGLTRAVHTPELSPFGGRSLFAPALTQGPQIRIHAIHTSPPLLDVLEVINKRSHNFMAEQVLRTVGRVVMGDGSIEGATAGMTAFGQNVLGLDSASFRPFDGSGLSALNRASPNAIVEALRFAAKSPMWTSFWHTLPQTGARDGLRRMAGTPAEGRVWAKTGTINSVSALSGYVRAGNGEWLAFSIINNRASSAVRAKRLEDQIVARLAAFDRSAGDIIGAGAEESPR